MIYHKLIMMNINMIVLILNNNKEIKKDIIIIIKVKHKIFSILMQIKKLNLN